MQDEVIVKMINNDCRTVEAYLNGLKLVNLKEIKPFISKPISTQQDSRCYKVKFLGEFEFKDGILREVNPLKRLLGGD